MADQEGISEVSPQPSQTKRTNVQCAPTLVPAGGPVFPGFPPDEECVAKVPEKPEVAVSDNDKPVAFCASPPCEKQSKNEQTDCPGSAACVVPENLWKGRQVLRVLFMNPEHLKKWTYKGKPITTEMIMEWANVWIPKDHEDSKVPTFIETTSASRSDIRVEFSDSDDSNWSMVGMQASTVKPGKPTMMLNLGCGCQENERSLVIHEFGHALGLEHEHQRSDFWDSVEKHIDLERMKEDERVKDPIAKEGKASFGDGWFSTKEGVLSAIGRVFGFCKQTKDEKMVKSQYDPESIMHYGFDKHWIKNTEYHDIRVVHSMSKEELPEKEYLMGILKRHHSMASNPSQTDLTTLEDAYQEISSSS